MTGPRRSAAAFAASAALLAAAGCGGGKPATSVAPRSARERPPAPSRPPAPRREGGYDETGDASYYGGEFAGRPTASGELFDPDALTAAHRTLPLGTELEVTNLDSGLSATVRINDRGPFVKNRILDCSTACARTLGYIGDGTARVGLRVVKLGAGKGAKIPPPASPRPAKPAPAPHPPPSSSPSPSPNPAPAPAPIPQPRYTGDAFAIQIGAFTDSSRAAAKLNEFQRQGEKGYLQPAGAFLRVRLGPYSSEAAARDRLAVLGVDGLVIREDNPPPGNPDPR